MRSIDMTIAIRRMRLIKSYGNHYRLAHYTYNSKTNVTHGLRIVDKAFTRKALPSDVFKNDPDLYFTYQDIDIDEPRMCFKCLIAYVSFPPYYEQLKVIHNNE